jgi:hypothetical protein
MTKDAMSSERVCEPSVFRHEHSFPINGDASRWLKIFVLISDISTSAWAAMSSARALASVIAELRSHANGNGERSRKKRPLPTGGN